MPDLNWLTQHPANLFARECLNKLKVPPDPRTTPLFQLAQEWLNRAPKNSLPWPEYQTELKERANQLATDDPVFATSLLVNEFERLQRGAEKLPAGSARWPVLSRHLDHLLPDLKRQPTVQAAGQLLAENLYGNLREAYPAFGHPSESQ